MNMRDVLDDTKYAVKVVVSVLAGYRGLQYKDFDGDWVNVERYKFPDNPYYICAVFENGRHIPLPLVLGENNDAGPLQKAVLWFMERRCNSRGLLRAMYRAAFDCAWYEHDFEIADAVEEEAYEIRLLMGKGVPQYRAEDLVKAGYNLDNIPNASDEELLAIAGIGPRLLAEVRMATTETRDEICVPSYYEV